jgi:hypothetical protein
MHQPGHRIPLAQQQLGQKRAVLSGDAGDQGATGFVGRGGWHWVSLRPRNPYVPVAFSYTPASARETTSGEQIA